MATILLFVNNRIRQLGSNLVTTWGTNTMYSNIQSLFSGIYVCFSSFAFPIPHLFCETSYLPDSIESINLESEITAIRVVCHKVSSLNINRVHVSNGWEQIWRRMDRYIVGMLFGYFKGCVQCWWSNMQV